MTAIFLTLRKHKKHNERHSLKEREKRKRKWSGGSTHKTKRDVAPPAHYPSVDETLAHASRDGNKERDLTPTTPGETKPHSTDNCIPGRKEKWFQNRFSSHHFIVRVRRNERFITRHGILQQHYTSKASFPILPLSALSFLFSPIDQNY